MTEKIFNNRIIPLVRVSHLVVIIHIKLGNRGLGDWDPHKAVQDCVRVIRACGSNAFRIFQG